MSSLAPINDINLNIFDEICEERFGKLDIDTVLVTIIDNLPTSALPHLAEQYHITGNEGWLHATTEDAKRALIKSAIKIHRYKGTKFALQEIFDSLMQKEYVKILNNDAVKATVDILPNLIEIITLLTN